MAGIDRSRTAQVLREFVEYARVEWIDGDPWGNDAGWQPVHNRVDVDARAHVAEKILDRVLPGWRDGHWEWSGSRPYDQQRRAAIRAIAELETHDELVAMLGDEAPELSAGQFHRWVWDGAKSLWDSGHRREAVNAAARTVNAHAQAKLARRDLSEWRLLSSAFSLKEPEAGEPRLRLRDDDGGDTYRNLHEGAGFYSRGLYQAIRNPANHEVLDELDERTALEQLAAFSVLARWIEDARVVRAAEPGAT